MCIYFYRLFTVGEWGWLCRGDGEPQQNDSAELVESGRESCAEEDLKPSDLLPKTRGLLQSRRILRICKWGKFCCCCNLSWILIRYKFVSDKKNIFRSLIYISAIVRILAKYHPMSESLPSEKRIIMWMWWLKVQPVLDSFKLLFFSLVWLYCA